MFLPCKALENECFIWPLTQPCMPSELRSAEFLSVLIIKW
jgi:hypothetical protein